MSPADKDFSENDLADKLMGAYLALVGRETGEVSEGDMRAALEEARQGLASRYEEMIAQDRARMEDDLLLLSIPTNEKTGWNPQGDF